MPNSQRLREAHENGWGICQNAKVTYQLEGGQATKLHVESYAPVNRYSKTWDTDKARTLIHELFNCFREAFELIDGVVAVSVELEE